jgi:hypothetical protein
VLYVFEHIPKTAGTSFNGYLRSAFATSAVEFITGHMPEMAEDIARIAASSDADLARTRVISGHSAGELRGRLPHARFITMVREPIARLYSAHQHHLNYPGALDRFGWAKDISLDDFAEVPGEADVLSKTLLGELQPQMDDMTDEEISDRLAARYFLVGTSARMEEFIFLLHEAAAFPLALFVNQNERTRHLRKTIIASDTMMETLRRDIRVHGIVQQAFDRRFGETCDDRSLKVFRIYVEALQAFTEDGDPSQPGYIFAPAAIDRVTTELSLSEFREAGEAVDGLRVLGRSVQLRTSEKAWGYAAALPFGADLVAGDRATFIELDLTVIRGQIAIATTCQTTDDGLQQRQFEASSTRQVAIVPVASTLKEPLIIVRNGEAPRASVVRIDGARVVSTSLTGRTAREPVSSTDADRLTP